MALDAVVYPQDPFGYISCKDCLINNYFLKDQDQEDKSLVGADFEIPICAKPEQDSFMVYLNHDPYHQWFGSVSDTNGNVEYKSSSQYPLCPLEGFNPITQQQLSPPAPAAETPALRGRRKRRRTKSSKNKEEIENQRMTHIAVERNRRKQMNEYLAVLRSLMPPYPQRGDQASIIGGAINYVKELEQLLHSLEANPNKSGEKPAIPFSNFFSYPQYSSRSMARCDRGEEPEAAAAAAADIAAEIEVTMVDSHANVKILTKKRPRQLLKLVSGIQALRLSILHLNLTTLDRSVLYTVSVRAEEGSQMNSVDEISAAVNQILRKIEDEAA